MFANFQTLRRIGASSAVLMLSAVGGLDAVEAQAAGGVPAIRQSVRHIRSINPTSGPVGTQIQVWSDGLPRNTRVHVAIGEQHGCGYQVCSTAQTDARGELTVATVGKDVIVEGHVVQATCNFQNAIEVVSVDVPPAGS